MKSKLIIWIFAIFLLASFASAAIDDADFHYTIDDADRSGNSLTDTTGNGYTGTNLAGTLGVSGIINEAVDFDDGNINRISNSYNPNGLAAFTFCTWFEVDQMTDGHANYIYSTTAGTKGDNDLQLISTTDFLLLRLSTDDNTEQSLQSNAALIANVEYHACITYDGTTAKMYINGTAQTATISATGNWNTGSEFIIADWKSKDGARDFDGMIDEISLYPNAKTPTEILEIYNKEKAGTQYPYLSEYPINMTGSYFTPNSSVYTSTSFTAYASVNDTTDAAVNYTIYKNDVAFLTGSSTTFVSTTATLGTIVAANTTQQDIFRVEAYAVNSSDTSVALSEPITSNNLTIENRIPTLSNAELQPTTLLNTINITGIVDAADLDTDELNLTYNLFRNRTGSFVNIQSGTILNTLPSNDIQLFEYDSASTQEDDQYYFTVQAYDGINLSNNISSAIKTVVVLDVWEFTLRSNLNSSLLEGVSVSLWNGTDTFVNSTDSNGFVSFREDTNGITGDWAVVNFTKTPFVSDLNGNYTNGGHNVYLAPEGAIFHLNNLFDDSNVSGFTVTTSAGSFTSAGDYVWIDDLGTYSYTISKTNFRNVTGSYTANSQVNATHIFKDSYQHRVNLTAEKKILGDVINSFNITIGSKAYGTTNGSLGVFLDLGAYSLTGSSAGFIDVTNSYAASGLNGEDTFEFGSATLNLTAVSYSTGATINSFSVILRHANGYNETKSTTTGTISFGVVDGEIWELFFDSALFAGLTVNVTQVGNFTAYEATLFDFNSISFNFIDVNTFLPLDKNILIDVIGETGSSNHILFIENTQILAEEVQTVLTTYSLADTFTFNNSQEVSQISWELESAVGDISAFSTFYYEDGTALNSSVSTYTGTYARFTENNPDTSLRVETIETYFKTTAGSGKLNDSVLVFDNPTFREEFLQPENYELRFAAEGYNPRSAFLTVLNNSANNLTFYMNPNASTTLQLVKVIDTNNIDIAGGVLVLQKQVINQSQQYYTIQEIETNTEGLSSVWVKRSTVDFYRFAVLINGSAVPILPNLNLFTTKTNFFPNVIETVQLIVDTEETIGGFSSAFNNVLTNVTFSGAGNRTATYTWFDGENTITGARLKVYGRFLGNSSIKYTLISDQTASTTSGNLVYTLPNINNSEYRVEAYILVNGYEQITDVQYKTIGNTDKPEKNFGMFLTIIIMLFVALTTSKLGTLLSSILTFASLFLCVVIGLANIPATIISSLIAFSIIVFVRVRSSNA